jgi:phosphoribosylformylglycinamidine synthase
MGLVISDNHLKVLHKIADRERSPIYDVGDVTGETPLYL